MVARTTKFTTTRLGTGLRGNELDECYSGQVGDVNQRHGNGKYAYPNPMFAYEGEYVNGRKHGKGRLTIGEGFYEGDFADDEIQGSGTRVWGDGSQFTGHFEMGEPVGEGVFIGANGDKYEGEFVGYTRQGEGVLQLASGDVYTGTFRSHNYNGVGELIGADGSRHRGSWVDGLAEGDGDYTGSNGDSYKGNFSKGIRSGKGAAYFASVGVTYDGVFQEGNPELQGKRIEVVDPPQAEPGTKNAEIAEVSVGIQPEWNVTLQVQHKVEKWVSEADAPAKGKKGKKSSGDQEGPQLVTEWHPLSPESGRAISMHILEGDLTTATEEELAAAEKIPLDPTKPDVAEVVAVTKEGVAVFPALLLGKPLPIETSGSDTSRPGSSATTASKKGKGAPAPAKTEDAAEEEPVFAGGTYTLRFSCDGVPLITSMKLNVIGADGSGGKKGKK